MATNPEPIPWGIAYGLTRSLLATSTLITFLLNTGADLFVFRSGALLGPYEELGVAGFSFFAIAGAKYIEAARWVAVALLVVCGSGWRPRIMAPIHWWISASFAASSTNIDGGDHVCAVLTLILLPVALTDNRRSHWDSGARDSQPTQGWLNAEIARSALLVARIQVAVIYLQAAVAKMRVAEWADGTALHYWFRHPLFGAPVWMRTVMDPVLNSSAGVVLLTWGVLILELILFAGIFASRAARPRLFVAGVVFHVLIGMIHGLWSFAIAMIGALTIYLLDDEAVIRLFARTATALNKIGFHVIAARKHLLIGKRAASFNWWRTES